MDVGFVAHFIKFFGEMQQLCQHTLVPSIFNEAASQPFWPALLGG